MITAYTEVYSGKAMIVPEGTPYATATGGAQLADARYEVGIPASAEPVLPNDVITVDSSSWDPNMEGMVLYVIGSPESTFLTHRRLTCLRKQVAI